MKYLVIACLLLSGCAFNPKLGMTYDQFKTHYNTSSRIGMGLRLVGAQDSITAYELEGVFYYFDNDVLVKVDQGQLYEQRIRLAVE